MPMATNQRDDLEILGNFNDDLKGFTATASCSKCHIYVGFGGLVNPKVIGGGAVVRSSDPAAAL